MIPTQPTTAMFMNPLYCPQAFDGSGCGISSQAVTQDKVKHLFFPLGY